MREDKNYYIVDKTVLPEIFLKVMEVKNLLESKKEKTVQDAVNKVGISRSAFYKYRDAVHPLYENTRGKTVTVSMNLDHTPGLLSSVLNGVAVFVPLFTNQITSLMAGGTASADAAVRSIHSLAIAELLCIAAGITAVLFLPRIRNKGEAR